MMVPFTTAAQVRRAIAPVREWLERGGVLAHPTETVYGLGTRARVPDVEAIQELKGRADPKPLILLVDGIAMVEALGLELTPVAGRLAEAFWPGPLTLVLRGDASDLPDDLRGRGGGIGVRWTSHPGMQVLLTELGEPVTSTSANRTGDAPAVTPEEVSHLFGDAVAAGRLMVLDGGPLTGRSASTVVDCTGPAPEVLREGAIAGSVIHAIVGSATT